MPIHISITHAFAGVLSAKLFNLRFVSQHQISGRAVKSICREFVECASESERESEQESCLFPYLVSHFFTFLLDFCGIFGAQVNCLPLPLSLSLFPFLYLFLSPFFSLTLLRTYARRRRVAGSLSAAEIPHHAEQTLVNYFYYIHGYSCTVTQFDP